jgi:hypothetical protein
LLNLGDGIAIPTDRLIFGAGILPSDLAFMQVGQDLMIRHLNGLDEITVKNWFVDGNTTAKIERLSFADDIDSLRHA